MQSLIMTSKKRGMLIVIDGIDGSGKSVQTDLLCKRLEAEGHTIVTPSFPRYECESSYFVREMLKGGYKDLGSTNPHVTSMFYAFDRMDAAMELHKAIADGKLLICNRYTSSNVGHQGGRFDTPKERKNFYAWLDHFEYEQLKIPRPDAVIYLHVTVPTSIKLMDIRVANKEREKKDIYEEDTHHLEMAYQSYREAASLFPYWQTIECMKGDDIRSPEEIHEMIWDVAMGILKNQA